jgi:hypothetical protein
MRDELGYTAPIGRGTVGSPGFSRNAADRGLVPPKGGATNIDPRMDKELTWVRLIPWVSKTEAAIGETNRVFRFDGEGSIGTVDSHPAVFEVLTKTLFAYLIFRGLPLDGLMLCRTPESKGLLRCPRLNINRTKGL